MNIDNAREVPPGTKQITLPDKVQAGDYFFYEPLSAWMPVPKSAVGQSCVGLMARGKVDMTNVPVLERPA